MFCKKLAIVILSALCLHPLLGQKTKVEIEPNQLKSYQKEYEDDSFLALDITENYSFELEDEVPQVKRERKEQILLLKDNKRFEQALFFDENSSVKFLEARDGDGKKVKEVLELDNPYEYEGIFHNDSRIYSFTFPRADAGDAFQFKTEKRITDLKYFTSIYFNEYYPQNKHEVVLDIPDWLEVEILEKNFENANVDYQKTTKSGSTEHRYTIKNIKARDKSSRMPGPSHYLPHLLIICKSYKVEGSKRPLIGSIDDLYGWYRGLVKSMDNQTDELKPVVNKIIAGKTSDKEKIEAIYYWVQDNIRYIAFEDGIAGFKPDDAHKVCEKKYGDCKGMSNLTKEMLKIAGFDARLTWIGTRHIAYDYSTPSISVDNHMICSLFHDDKIYFLDPTEDYAALGQNALRIQGKQVLIEDGDNYILERVPNDSFLDNSTVFALELNVDGDQLKGNYKLEFSGEAKTRILGFFHNTPSNKKEEHLRKYLSNNDKNWHVSNVKNSDLTLRNQAVEFEFDIALDNHILEIGGEKYVTIDCEQAFKNFEIDTSRTSHYLFSRKYHNIQKVVLNIPDGHEVSYVPENLNLKHEDFDMSIDYKKEADKVVYERVINIKSGTIKKQDLDTWNDYVKQLREKYKDQIILKKQ